LRDYRGNVALVDVCGAPKATKSDSTGNIFSSEKLALTELMWIVPLLPMPTAVMGLGVSPALVCLSVCLILSCLVFYPHDISKTAAARITKRDIRFTMSPGNTFILGSKDQRSVPARVFALLGALVS